MEMNKRLEMKLKAILTNHYSNILEEIDELGIDADYIDLKIKVNYSKNYDEFEVVLV